MALKIKQDQARFREIVRGRIKQNLKKYITQGELIGRKGKETVSIPVPQINIPHFTFGEKEQGGVGMGEGREGQRVQPGQGDDGHGHGAGGSGGDHMMEVDVSFEELADILGEELGLPAIEPKGTEDIEHEKIRYTGINTTGPESLRHFKRTYKQALRRQLMNGTYNPNAPLVVPSKEDRRYRTYHVTREPDVKAVIFYMMDVSGSMGDDQKEIVRIESFWIDTWLRRYYKGLDVRYIIHDAAAKEVDRDTFFHTRESGGTMISSAYSLCAELIDQHYPADQWNIYPFHFSDGDNWSSEDTKISVDLLKERILPKANVFFYGQVESPYGSGQFIKDLHENFEGNPAIITSEIKDKNAIAGSIKDFLGKKKP